MTFGVVAQMAQQVGVMQYGKLVEVGQASQVLTAPQHAYTRKLLASVPENLVKPARSSASVTLGTVEQAELPPLIQTQAIKVWFP